VPQITVGTERINVTRGRTKAQASPLEPRYARNPFRQC